MPQGVKRRTSDRGSSISFLAPEIVQAEPMDRTTEAGPETETLYLTCPWRLELRKALHGERHLE